MKKLIAITGANSGIGLASAKLFASKNYPMLLIDKNIDVLETIDFKNCLIKKIDVRDFNSLNQAIIKAQKEFGSVDLMLNNAGIMPLDKYYEQSLQDKYDIIDTNIKGVINGMDAVLPSMIKENSGTIINISSTAGRFTYDDHSVYNGSKFAVNAITQQARRELAHTNIRFSLIEPAIVNTNLLSTVKNQKIKDEYLQFQRNIDNGLKPETIAQTILYIYELPQDVTIKEILISHTNESEV